jgi:large subunit ribosomal protein L23
MKDVYRVVRRALLTEKTTALQARNKYVFEVDRRAAKPEIKRAIEEIFKVTVVDVRTMNVRGKLKRLGRFEGLRPAWKKAVVTLAPGDTIDAVVNNG